MKLKVLKYRLEHINEYDLELGLLRTLRKVHDRIRKNFELLEITEDPDTINRLIEEIENDEAEVKFISSSLLFERDILLMVQRSNLYVRMER